MSAEKIEGGTQKKKPRTRKGGEAKSNRTKAAVGARNQHKAEPTDDKSRTQLGKAQQTATAISRVTGWRDPVSWFTGVLVIVGITQAWSFVQSERAFVSIGRIGFVGGLAAGKELSVTSTLKNSGRSTAFIEGFNLTYRFLIKGRQLPPTVEYSPGADLAPGNVVPGGEATVNSDLRGLYGATRLDLADGDIADINEGKRTLYLYGYVSYRDPFSVFGNRITGFCYTYSQISKPPFINCSERAYTYAR